jgi:hypothetical protein
MAMNAVDIAMAAQEFSDDLAGATLLAAAETSFYAVVLQFETADGRRLKTVVIGKRPIQRAHLLGEEI